LKIVFKITVKTVIVLFCFLILAGAPTKSTAQVNINKYEKQKKVKKLITIFQDKDENVRVRRQAISALGRLKDVRAVEPLIAVLNNEDVNVSSAGALGNIGDIMAVEPLIAALNDDKMKIASVWALGNIGDKKAIEPLVAVLTNKYSLGREEAAKVLDDFGWKPSTDMEKAYYFVAKRDWNQCITLGKPAIEPLISTLNDGKDNARIGAMETLDKLGWIPEEDNKEAYKATESLKKEIMAEREGIVLGEMKLMQEYEENLIKLNEEHEDGNLSLTEAEYSSLVKRYTQDIQKEREEIENFRTELDQIEFSIRRIDDEVILVREKSDNVTIHSVKRGPNGRRLMDFWFDRWTGKPTKEFDWISGNFYRFNHKGSKYLFAKYTLNDSLSHDIYILYSEGTAKERIHILYQRGSIWEWQSKISTKIGQDKWIEWPTGDKLTTKVSERSKLLEAEFILSIWTR